MTSFTGASSTSGANAAAAGSATGTASDAPTDTEPRENAAGDKVAGSSTAEPAVTDSQVSQAAADGDPDAVPAASGEYDPSADGETVDKVNAYLATADPAEQARVLAAERDGKARAGVLSANEDPAVVPQPLVAANDYVFGSATEDAEVANREEAERQRAADLAALAENPDVPLMRPADESIGGEFFAYG